MALRWNSLRGRFLLALVLANAPFLVAAVGVAVDRATREMAAAETALRAETQTAGRTLGEAVEGARQLLYGIAGSGYAKSRDARRCNEHLKGLVSELTRYTNIWLLDDQGRTICSYLPFDGTISLADRDWFQDARRTKALALGRIAEGVASGVPVITASYPIFDDGKFLGVAAVGIKVDWVIGMVNRVTLPNRAVLGVIDSSLRVVLPAGFTPAVLPPHAVLTEMSRSKAVAAAPAEDGTRRLYAVEPVRAGAVSVIGIVPQLGLTARIVAEIGNSMWPILLIIVSSFLVIAVVVDRVVLRPLSGFAAAVTRYREGDFTFRPRPVHAPWEIRELARRFRKMAAAIGRREKRLTALVEDRELLLQETHHRVKNNLQMVASLLALHGDRVASLDAREALYTARKRVQSLAMLHTYLSEHYESASVDMPEFIGKLCKQLRGAVGTESYNARVRIEAEIAPLRASSRDALALGLLINEAVTNALKHGFPGTRAGAIVVRLAVHGDRVLMTISDNGAGAAAGGDERGASNLGRTIMEGLARQLGGTMTIEHGDGTTVSLDFPVPPTGLTDAGFDEATPPAGAAAARAPA